MARKNALGKLLQELDKEELIAEIEKICDKFEVVRDYFHIDLTGDTSAYVAQTKKKIEGQFYTAAGKARRPKASRLNKIIADFEILSIYKEDLVQLHLFRVEKTLAFIKKHSYYAAALLQSTLRSFTKACMLIADNDLTEKYAQECADINAAGYWVFLQGEMDAIFYTYFPKA
jgi:hypothetical protein